MEIVERLAGQHIMVIGDVMIDRYLSGSVHRISPEAPVPIVQHTTTEDRLGGAANVALNIAALDSVPLLFSVVGDDEDGHLFVKIMEAAGLPTLGIVTSKNRIITVKTRILGNNQQILRIDREQTNDLEQTELDQLLLRVQETIQNYPIKAVVLQDYNKGVLSQTAIQHLLGICQANHIPVTVDPKKRNFFAYQGVTLFKPNLKEIRESLGTSIQPELKDLELASRQLKEKLGNAWTMITLSEHGLFLDDGNGGAMYPTHTQRVADVSGAGDTVISVATLGMAAGLSSAEIARLSNFAGGLVCQQPGVVPIDKHLLIQELTQ